MPTTPHFLLRSALPQARWTRRRKSASTLVRLDSATPAAGSQSTSSARCPSRRSPISFCGPRPGEGSLASGSCACCVDAWARPAAKTGEVSGVADSAELSRAVPEPACVSKCARSNGCRCLCAASSIRRELKLFKLSRMLRLGRLMKMMDSLVRWGRALRRHVVWTGTRVPACCSEPAFRIRSCSNAGSGEPDYRTCAHHTVLCVSRLPSTRSAS